MMHSARNRQAVPSAALGAAVPNMEHNSGTLPLHQGPPPHVSRPPSGQPPARHGTNIPESVDSYSTRGVFGWTIIDNVNVPYIVRSKCKYVSVRMVEHKLLSKYPSTYPDEVKDRPPLTSQYVTVNEAKLLNYINTSHCNSEYGSEGFDTKDLIVALSDFEEFYYIVKRHYPEESAKEPTTQSVNNDKQYNSTGAFDGGWMQVNNTIVPFVVRKGIKLVPLPVIRYGANLLNNVQVSGLECSEKEVNYFNQTCKSAGLDFTFSKASTKLIEISLVPTLSESKPVITELPKDDPFGHAMYRSEEDIEHPSANYPSAMQGFPQAVTTSQPSRNAVATASTGPVKMAPTTKGPVPRSQASDAMPWMAPYMGMYPPVSTPPGAPLPPQSRGPPPPYQAPPSSISQSLNMAPHLPGHSPSPLQQHIPTSLPTISPNAATGSRPSSTASADSALDLSSKSPSPAPVAANGGRRSSTPSADRVDIVRNIQQTIRSITRPQLEQHKKPNDVGAHPKKARRSNTGPPRTNIIQLADGRTIELQSTSFHGKGITCIIKDGDGFALLESLNRMFFPKCSLDTFARGISDILKLEIKELTPEEEQAFISHYELKIKNLRCTKVVSLGAMDLHMSQMKYMFNPSDDKSAVLAPLPTVQKPAPPPAPAPAPAVAPLISAPAPPPVSAPAPAPAPAPSSQDTNNNTGALQAAMGPAPHVQQVQHRAACQALKNFIGKRVASGDAEPSAPPAKKTPSPASNTTRPAKHSTGKLENIMNKLKKAQMQPSSTESSPVREKTLSESESEKTANESPDEATDTTEDLKQDTVPEKMEVNEDKVSDQVEEASKENVQQDEEKKATENVNAKDDAGHQESVTATKQVENDINEKLPTVNNSSEETIQESKEETASEAQQANTDSQIKEGVEPTTNGNDIPINHQGDSNGQDKERAQTDINGVTDHSMQISTKGIKDNDMITDKAPMDNGCTNVDQAKIEAN